MISQIEYHNYKAFEEAKIPIKPITILLGANSVGKSSIIQSLLMFQQTGKAGLKSYKSALKLYGGYVNLGDPLNLFRKRDTSKPLEFTFDLKSRELKDYFQSDLFNSFVRIFSEIPMFLPFKGFSEVRETQVNNLVEFEKILDAIIDFLSKTSTKEKYQDEVKYFLRYRQSIKVPEINKKNKRQIIELYKFLDALRKNTRNDYFSITYSLRISSDNTIEIQAFNVIQNNKKIISFVNDENVSLNSDFISFSDKDRLEFLSIFDNDNTIFNCFQSKYNHLDELSVKMNIFSQIMYRIQLELQDEFSESNINYVSPLRAHPKRYYMLDKAKLNLTLNTLDGDAIAEVLKDNKGLTKKVNSWLTKFGLEVDVKEFKEVIHHLVVKQNDLDLDITDVGFGISQVLPVIIQGFLSDKNSTTIIEQPEIHLHPKIQADLADLFIDIIKISPGRKIIIETHSEYILKRLRRRISENVISADKVAICLFSPQNNKDGAQVEVLEIAEKGFFEWPEDFYGGELFRDTTEFLINQE